MSVEKDMSVEIQATPTFVRVCSESALFNVLGSIVFGLFIHFFDTFTWISVMLFFAIMFLFDLSRKRNSWR